MPCINNYPDVRYEERLHDGKNAARLCAIMQVLEAHNLADKVLTEANWKEAGTSRSSFDRWWAEHKEIDAKRKANELSLAKRKKQARALAQKPWASLTKAERSLVRQFADD